MFLIFYFFFWLQSSTSSASFAKAESSQPVDIGEMKKMLNEIRCKKNLNAEESLSYDELIERSKQLDESQKEIIDKIAWLRNYIKDIYEETENPHPGLARTPYSYFKSIYIINDMEISSMKNEQAPIISEVKKFLLNPIISKILSEDEMQRLLMLLSKFDKIQKEAKIEFEKKLHEITILRELTVIRERLI